ncbi:MAG: 3-oxoacyl-ACP reductase FabG [Gammaproteobacteria bacterium]|nr:3-oxoacyl-ACP reductase FabG [Gammaproteobacteria bacterium]MDH4253890.1 3-oxoacyl-ACP reductase FabG [Gammaproteobacteria bacterium]MDH5309797.1 3-oxoacyl-ACP reductase FabG [Gammaproteobacteria bacterium]
MKFSFATDILDGKVALVTGASRGIGAAIARTLADAGARVVGTATSAAGAAAISATLADRGRGLVLDVGSDASVDEALADIGGQEGAPLIVVNNAGITRDNLLMRMKADEWNDVISTNLSGVYRVCKGCLRGMMKARYGRIVNIASVVGVMGNPGQTNYSAAKAGIIGFSKSMAREVGSRDITVNVVAPGFIDTDMTRVLTEAQRAAMLGQIPLARLGEPEDIAAAVLFLASDAGRYITGETLHVNGGMLMD